MARDMAKWPSIVQTRFRLYFAQNVQIKNEDIESPNFKVVMGRKIDFAKLFCAIMSWYRKERLFSRLLCDTQQ